MSHAQAVDPITGLHTTVEILDMWLEQDCALAYTKARIKWKDGFVEEVFANMLSDIVIEP